MKKNTSVYLLAFLLFAAGVGWLCYAGFGESGVYFLNVAEARAVTPDSLSKARLFGLVRNDGLQKKINGVEFNLEDKDNSDLFIPVVYVGPVPDAFKQGAEVIVEGSMQANGSFTAKTLMTKCPSKYQKQNRS